MPTGTRPILCLGDGHQHVPHSLRAQRHIRVPRIATRQRPGASGGIGAADRKRAHPGLGLRDVGDAGAEAKPHPGGAHRRGEPQQLVIEDSGQDAVEGPGVTFVGGFQDRLAQPFLPLGGQQQPLNERQPSGRDEPSRATIT
jgi:hypothetical protein